MQLTLAQWLVIGICAVLILGYIAGYYYNRQRAGRILAWLRSGLEKWGAVSAGGRLPGMITGGQLIVQKASEPFQRIEAVYLLAPRENLLFWLFHRLQGRGDELVLKIFLPKVPKTSMEAKRNWRSKFIYHGQGVEEKWAGFLARYGRSVFHLVLRREAPHLFVRVYLPALMADSAGAFIASLSDLIA
jgi:hypothetical protein